MPQVPAVSAEALLHEALSALDTCMAALSQIDQQLETLKRTTEAEHRALRQILSEVDAPNLRAITDDYLPSLPDGRSFTIDHQAILNDERALQQERTSLRLLDDRIEYLTNLLRLGRARVHGKEPEATVTVPWEAATQAARIEAQEEERMRLAREVHDGPAQVLANAILGLEYCQIVATRAPAELDAELQRLRLMIREGLGEVRRFMFDLRPTMLASVGLRATLQRYIEDYQQNFGISIELDLPAQELAIEDRAQIVVFRIVQESLQNIQKHAQASHIRIALTHLNDHALQLRIEDNGTGFDPKAVRPTSRSGAGLLGMEERAAMLGGRLTIESSIEVGTIVTLYLPVQPSALSHHVAEAPSGPLVTQTDSQSTLVRGAASSNASSREAKS